MQDARRRVGKLNHANKPQPSPTFAMKLLLASRSSRMCQVANLTSQWMDGEILVFSAQSAKLRLAAARLRGYVRERSMSYEVSRRVMRLACCCISMYADTVGAAVNSSLCFA